MNEPGQVTVDVVLTPEQIAAAFAGLSDDDQAQVFIEVARLAAEWPPGNLDQWYAVGRHLAEWREMPILGHGLWARYQDAQMLLDDAEKLLTAVAAERGDVAEQLAEALRKLIEACDECLDPTGHLIYIMGPDVERARAALASFTASREETDG